MALRLFGEREYAAVALRDIAVQAGVSLTLIDHHFGAKHALFASVVRTWCPVFEHATLEIHRATAQGRLASTAALLELLLHPFARLRADPDGMHVLRLCARHRHETAVVISSPLNLALGPFRQAATQALSRLYPARSPHDHAWAVALGLAALLEHSLGGEAPDPGDPAAAAGWASCQQLVRHLEAGWRACLGH